MDDDGLVSKRLGSSSHLTIVINQTVALSYCTGLDDPRLPRSPLEGSDTHRRQQMITDSQATKQRFTTPCSERR